MNKTSLFHVSGNRYHPLPAKHHTRRIWEELGRDFDEYHVIACGIDNRYSHTVDGKTHLHLLPSFGRRMWPFLFLSWLLPLLVLRYKPTHIVAQCPVIGGTSAALCSFLFRIPLFLELHGAHYFYPARDGFLGHLEHIFYRCLSWPAIFAASRIRSLSENMSENIRRTFGQSAYKKSLVIPNRVDLEVFRFVKSDYSNKGVLRLISVGSFSPTKNHLSLIKDLCHSGVDLELTLVGAGPLKSEYIYLAKKLGFTNRLKILDSIDHAALAPLLAQHDIYVHYSLSEAVPRAILEAMSAALPVIATRVGFIKGILVDGVNSILIDQPYEVGLGDALADLEGSQQLRRKLGCAARFDIEDRFEWDQVFSLYRTSIMTMN